MFSSIPGLYSLMWTAPPPSHGNKKCLQTLIDTFVPWVRITSCWKILPYIKQKGNRREGRNRNRFHNRARRKQDIYWNVHFCHSSKAIVDIYNYSSTWPSSHSLCLQPVLWLIGVLSLEGWLNFQSSRVWAMSGLARPFVMNPQSCSSQISDYEWSPSSNPSR